MICMRRTPVTESAITALQNRIEAADAAGVSDDELLGDARATMQSLSLAASSEDPMMLLDEVGLLSLIQRAGLKPPGADEENEAEGGGGGGSAGPGADGDAAGAADPNAVADIEALRARARAAVRILRASAASLAQLVVVPSKAMPGAPFNVTNPFTLKVTILPDTQPGTAYLVAVPKPRDALAGLRAMGFETQTQALGRNAEHVFLEALAANSGNVGLVAEMFLVPEEMANFGAPLREGAPTCDASYDVPTEVARSFVPGQTLLVRDPYVVSPHLQLCLSPLVAHLLCVACCWWDPFHRVGGCEIAVQSVFTHSSVGVARLLAQLLHGCCRFNKGIIVRSLPLKWSPGTPIVLTFAKPLGTLNRLKDAGFSDEETCLRAIRESKGNFDAALALLRYERHVANTTAAAQPASGADLSLIHI